MKKHWISGIAFCVVATTATFQASVFAQRYSPINDNRVDARMASHRDAFLDEVALEPEQSNSTSQRVSQQLKAEYGQQQMMAPQADNYPMMAEPAYGQAPMYGNAGPAHSGHSQAGSSYGGPCDGGCGGNCGGGCGCGVDAYQGGCDSNLGRHQRYMYRQRDSFIGGNRMAGRQQGNYGYSDCGCGNGGSCGIINGNGSCGDNFCDEAVGRGYREGRGGAGLGLGIFDRGCDTYTVVGGGWLLMKRDGADFQPLSYENGMPGNQLSVSDANIQAQSGLEVFFARQSNEGRGWEMRYWGLNESDNSATLTAMPRTELSGLSTITIGAYGSAWGIYNAGNVHRISRESDLHNAEFNFLRYASSCGPCRNIVFRGIGGLRVLRFNDSLNYSTEGTGYYGSYGFDSLSLHSSVSNTIIAAQVGGTGEYCLSNKLRLAFGSKVGIGGNSIDADQCIDTSSGLIGQNASGNDYNYMNSASDFAMFGEFNTNLYYHVSDCVRLSVGYRLFGVSGVALAQKQLPYDFTDTNEINSINRDGGLLLQGLTIGAEFCR